MTKDIEESSSATTTTRRQFLVGAATVVAVVAAGGAGYHLWTPPATTAAPAAPGADVATAELMLPGPLGDQVMGSADAPVTIIEYASMTCPHCAHFHQTTYPEMKKKYVDTGKIRFIFREFPLDPLAAAGSMLARCAGKDKFFPLIETLFAQQKDWVVRQPLAPLSAIAKQAGFTQQSFEACLANQQVLDGIEEVRQRAVQKLGVNSTPTFFINGKIQRGAFTAEEMDKLIEPYLKG